MHFNSSSRRLFALFFFFSLSSALPFLSHPQVAQPEPLLIPRASYSVVPVDGGALAAATAGGDSGATTTIRETIIQTASVAPPATLTIVSTDIVPSGTETLMSIATVIGQDTITTSLITITPAATTITVSASEMQTVITEPTLTIETVLPAGVSSSASSSTSAFVSISTPCSTNSTTMETITTVDPVAATPSPTTSPTYDNGLWHTAYPAWSNSSYSTPGVAKPSQLTSLV